MQRAFAVRTVGMALAIAACCTAGGAAGDETLAQKTFDVSEKGTFVLDSDTGSVEVSSGSGAQVTVDVTFRADRMGRGEADRFRREFDIGFEQAGDTITVRARSQQSRSWWHRLTSNANIRFKVTVPRGFGADIRTGGGSVEVDDLAGDIRARTSGGSLRFGDIGGTVWGRTSGGSITLEGCRGEADVDTSGGSIRIGRVDGDVRAETSGGSISIEDARGRVNAETSGGGIRVREVMGAIRASTSGGSIEATITRQPEAECRLTTSGGSVVVYLAEGVAVDLDAEGNRVISDVPVEVVGTVKRSRMVGKINGGGPDLFLRTSGGSVKIRQR